jgi:hypothetical protein
VHVHALLINWICAYSSSTTEAAKDRQAVDARLMIRSLIAHKERNPHHS